MKKNNNLIKHNILFLSIIIVILVFAIYIIIYSKKLLISLNPYWTDKMYQSYIQLIIFTVFVITGYIVLWQNFKIKIKRNENEITNLNKIIENKISSIEKLNEKINENKLYDIKNNIWTKEVLNEYIEQLINKKVEPFTILKIQCLNQESENSLLMKCNFLLDENIIMIKLSELNYIFIFIYMDLNDTSDELKYILPEHTKVIKKIQADGLVDTKEELLSKIL